MPLTPEEAALFDSALAVPTPTAAPIQQAQMPATTLSAEEAALFDSAVTNLPRRGVEPAEVEGNVELFAREFFRPFPFLRNMTEVPGSTLLPVESGKEQLARGAADLFGSLLPIGAGAYFGKKYGLMGAAGLVQADQQIFEERVKVARLGEKGVSSGQIAARALGFASSGENDSYLRQATRMVEPLLAAGTGGIGYKIGMGTRTALQAGEISILQAAAKNLGFDVPAAAVQGGLYAYGSGGGPEDALRAGALTAGISGLIGFAGAGGNVARRLTEVGATPEQVTTLTAKIARAASVAKKEAAALDASIVGGARAKVDLGIPEFTPGQAVEIPGQGPYTFVEKDGPLYLFNNAEGKTVEMSGLEVAKTFGTTPADTTAPASFSSEALQNRRFDLELMDVKQLKQEADRLMATMDIKPIDRRANRAGLIAQILDREGMLGEATRSDDPTINPAAYAELADVDSPESLLLQQNARAPRFLARDISDEELAALIDAPPQAARPPNLPEPADPNAPQMSSEAQQVDAFYNAYLNEGPRTLRSEVEKLGRAANRMIFSKSQNLQNNLRSIEEAAGKKTAISSAHSVDAAQQAKWLRTLRNGSHPLAAIRLKARMDDIFGTLSDVEEQQAYKFIQSYGAVFFGELNPKGKLPAEVSSKAHAAYLDSYFATNPKLASKLTKSAAEYYGALRSDIIEPLYKEGILSQQAYDAIIARGLQYSPESLLKFMGKALRISETELKDNAGLIASDPRWALSTLEHAAMKKRFDNRANVAMYNLSQLMEENGIAIPALSEPAPGGVGVQYKAAPGGFRDVSAMIDGTEHRFWMPKESYDEWTSFDPGIKSSVAQAAGWLSGAKPFKMAATGLNPFFATVQVPRDMAKIFRATNEYSPVAPVAMAQMMSDMAAVAKDAFTKTGSYVDYANEGGLMEFMVHQGKQDFHEGKFMSKGTAETLNGAQKVMGYLNESAELLTRLALRRRALLNGKSNTEAAWTARSYMDFSEGGDLVKVADTIFPFTNVAMQSFRSELGAMRNNPGQYAFKTGQLIAAGAMLRAMANMDPDTMDQISPQEKRTQLIIPLFGLGQIKNGRWEYAYLRVPKDHEQQLFFSMGEAMADKAFGRDIDGEQMLHALREGTGLGASLTPPMANIVRALYGINPRNPKQSLYPATDNAVPVEGLPHPRSTEFYDTADVGRDPTNPAFVAAGQSWMGQKLGISPIRTQAMLASIIPDSSIYSAVTSVATRNALDWATPTLQDKQTLLEDLLKVTGLKNHIRYTNGVSQQEIEAARAKRMEATASQLSKERKLAPVFNFPPTQ